MTADYVAYHAAERPDAVAVIHDGRVLSFAELSQDIHKAVGAVRTLGLAPGSSVAIVTDHLYVHWLLLLACERLGIAAASILRSDAWTSGALLASVDLVFADPGCSTPQGRRVQALEPAWIERVLAGAEDRASLPFKTPGDPVRIVYTSGTTGAAKRFLVTRRMHDAVCAQWQWDCALCPGSRYLQTLPQSVRATYDMGCACLRFGGTLVLESRMSAISAISAHAVTHAILLPIVLQTELDRLPADFVKLRELTVVSFGAAVSESLRERVMARLATGLSDLYGTVEVGAVSAISRPGRDGFATLLPQVQAEAVDERGTPMPPGEAGQIRLKTPYMSERYIDDPETTARLFRNGWFYPGDVGTVGPGRQLKVLGRADDLLNLGGTKILPSVLEGILMKHVVAGDVGVSSLLNANGIEELCIAISDVRHGDQEVMDRVLHALRHSHVGRFHMVKLDHIPRSANGKLQRQALRAELARRLGAR